MRRRALLASIGGGLAALAGCLEGSPGDPADRTQSPPGTDTPTDTPDGTVGGTPPGTADGTPTADPTTADPSASAEVTVEELQLQYGVVTPTSADSIGLSHETTPYVVASVAVDGPLAREAFALAVGDERVAPTTLDRLYRTAWGGEQWYGENRGSGLLLFDLGGRPAGDVVLNWPGGERALGESARERLQRGVPSLSATIDVPETHSGTEAPPVKIDVTNDGDVPARFLGALNRVGPLIAYTPVRRVSELVSSDEPLTVEVPDEWGDDWQATPDDGEADVKYFLYYAGGEDSAGIQIVE